MVVRKPFNRGRHFPQSTYSSDVCAFLVVFLEMLCMLEAGKKYIIYVKIFIWILLWSSAGHNGKAQGLNTYYRQRLYVC